MNKFVHDKKHMKIHVIHDDRRIERKEPLMDGLIEQGIPESDIIIWPAQVLGDVVSSINASHKKIVKWAKDEELPMVCIAEDDVWFPRKDGWKYFIDNIPQDFDLYLSCTYVVPYTLGLITGFHLYIVNQKFYDRFLSVPPDVHIDTAMDNIDGDYRFCYPFPALQRAGFSANNKAFANYNSVLRPQDIYGEIHNL